MTRDYWSFALLLPLGWATFTPAFRWILNRKRDTPSWYVSQSNLYDSLWIAWAMRRSDHYIKLAGRSAYHFEFAVFIAAWIAITIYQTNT